MGIANYLTARYYEFADILIRPMIAAHKLGSDANLGDALKSLLAFTFIAGLASLCLFSVGKVLGSFVDLAFDGTANGVITAAITALLMFAAYVPVFIASFLILVVFGLVSTAFIWMLAKLLGGLSPFGRQFGALVLPFNAIFTVLAIVTAALNLIVQVFEPVSADLASLLSLVFMLPALLLAVYLVLLWVVFTAEANDIEIWKAAIAVLLPLAFGFVVIAVVAVIIATLTTALGGLGAFTALLG